MMSPRLHTLMFTLYPPVATYTPVTIKDLCTKIGGSIREIQWPVGTCPCRHNKADASSICEDEKLTTYSGPMAPLFIAGMFVHCLLWLVWVRGESKVSKMLLYETIVGGRLAGSKILGQIPVFLAPCSPAIGAKESTNNLYLKQLLRN